MRLATRCTVAEVQPSSSTPEGFQNVSTAVDLPVVYCVRKFTWSIGSSTTLMPTRARSDCSFWPSTA